MKNKGFTLIEVLIALTIIAVALTALMKATIFNVTGASRLKERMISHWVQEQGLLFVQLGLIGVKPNHITTESTVMLNQRWYWRIQYHKTALPSVQKISVVVSKKQSGPFNNALTGYRYTR